MRCRSSLLPLVAMCLILSTGCTLVHDPDPIDPHAPVALRPLAKELDGMQVDDLIVTGTSEVTATSLDSDTVRNIAKASEPAVVSIFVKAKAKVKVRLLPFVRMTVAGEGLGSGFFVHPDGYLLTNNHVIENAHEIYIQLLDGKQYEVDVVARDPLFDVALLKVEGDHSGFPVLPMGDSKEMNVGDFVVAVGNPIGLGHTVTLGIVSHTARNLTGVLDPTIRTPKFLQIDAAINPGSSGGPLIDLTGAWVGVNSAGIPGASNIGFTLPSSQVKQFLETVLAGKGAWEEQER